MREDQEHIIELPDGREATLTFIADFYQKNQPDENAKEYNLVSFWFDKAPNKKGLHQIYLNTESLGTDAFGSITGFYFDPNEQIDINLLKNMAESDEGILLKRWN